MLAKLRRHWDLLGRSIHSGEKQEENLRALGWFGIICAVFGTGISIMNFARHRGLISWTTVLFAVGGLGVLLACRVFKKRDLAVNIFVTVSTLAFTYYAVSGANEGFAILWTLLMPLANCYFMSVRLGIMTSLYFETLILILFYTPLRNNYAGVYSEIFMNRFPIVYLCGLMITAVSMTQYHESILTETEYTERLQAEVRRQAELAQEQTRVAVERADELEKLSGEMVETLARAIDAKDRYTNGHSFRVARYAAALARFLGWPEAEIDALKREALLHDIGKIGVPDQVLNKPGRLAPEEYDQIKAHARVGQSILSGLDGMSEAAEVAAYHHERYDGAGYPSGLSGQNIPKHARIISIADAYDAMHSDRVYRPALPDGEIMAELERESGKQFDPDFAGAFVTLLRQGRLPA